MLPGNKTYGSGSAFRRLFPAFRANRGATISLDGSAQEWSVRAFLMAGARVQLRFLLAATMACFLAGPCRADQPKAKIHAVPVKPQPVVAPAAPLRPEQMPATPPQVAFSNGQLTITAQNCTLGDILRAVRNQTGASVEVPANATERVVGSFGPGPARDVLASLLNGSHFNYVLLGSATDSNALDRVVLIVKTNGTEQPAAAPPETASAKPPVPATNAEGEEPVPDPAQESSDIFGEEQGATAEEQTQAPFGQPTNARTPEQMLQDMQNQQQMQQQIQQRQQQLGISPNMPMPRGLPPGVPQPPTAPQ